jgi:hypothetical protein
VDKYERLNENKLPRRADFDSLLYNTKCDKEDYERAVNVWDKFNCKTFMDYHNLYLTTDVLLLADVFENFRKTCQTYYGLDPANYISAPSLAWDAMLLKTKIEIELISDPKILDVIERQKRGGLCFVGSQRRTVANNHYLENYDKTKPEDYIIYLEIHIILELNISVGIKIYYSSYII